MNASDRVLGETTALHFVSKGGRRSADCNRHAKRGGLVDVHASNKDRRTGKDDDHATTPCVEAVLDEWCFLFQLQDNFNTTVVAAIFIFFWHIIEKVSADDVCCSVA